MPAAVQVSQLTQEDRRRRNMTAQDVWVVFFDAKKTEGMVPLSSVLRWNAQPHENFLTGTRKPQLTTALRRATTALDDKKVNVQ